MQLDRDHQLIRTPAERERVLQALRGRPAVCFDTETTGLDPRVANPLLGELGHHGGDTETLVPASNSPARQLGTDCPAVDQRGVPRAEPCTAGAVEVP